MWLRACCNSEIKLIPIPLTIKYGGREDQLSNQFGLDKFRVYALEKILKDNVLNDNQRRITCLELIRKCEIYAHGAQKRGKIKEYNIYMSKIDQYKSFI